MSTSVNLSAAEFGGDNITAPICRICLSEDDADNLFAPCRCKGHSLFVHRYCLNQWRLTLFSHGYLKSGQKMRCNVCQHVYEVQGNWLGGLLQTRVGELSVIALILSTFLLGLFYNITHFFTLYVLQGEEGVPSNGFQRTGQMARLLRDSTCSSFGPMTIPCLPISFQPLIPILAPLFAAATVLLDGCILGVIIVKSVPKKLRLIFYVVHVLAVYNTGLLMPFEYLDLVQNFLIEAIYNAETALVGSLVFAKTVLFDATWFPLQSVDDEVVYRSSAQISQIAANLEKQIHNSWLMAAIRMLYLVLVSAWIYIVKYYYTLIVAWSGLRAYSTLEASVKTKLARAVGFGFREYRGVR